MLGRILLLAMLVLGGVAHAQEQGRGPVTNLPMPRYVSIKGAQAYMRRGPAQTHRIDWVLRHRGTPLRVTAEYGAWRRVTDVDGVTGWVHSIVLSRVRNVVVTLEQVLMFEEPDPDSAPVAKANRGVIGRLLRCNLNWCEIRADGYRGWVAKSGIWGVDPDEVFE